MAPADCGSGSSAPGSAASAPPVSLFQAGFVVDVFEQAPELTEVGGGIMGRTAAGMINGT